MRPNRALLLRVLGVAGIAVTLDSCARPHVSDDLSARLGSARRQPTDGAFDIVNATSDIDTMRCIRTHGATRLTYHVTVATGATLSVWTPKIPSSAADQSVEYLIGVSDGHAYRTVSDETTDPATAHPSTKWRNSRFRLNEYTGMTINVVFNTRTLGSSSTPPAVGLWCSPEILVR